MYAIGIDIGGMSIKCGIVSDKGEVVETYTLTIDRARNPQDIINDLVDGLEGFLGKTKINLNDIKGIGVGFPGPVNTTTGTLGYASNLNWEGICLKGILEKEFNKPTRITNDANAATLAEYKFGSGTKHKDVVMLTLGTGVGGGLIINGKLYEGTDGKGAELGHITLYTDGLPCGCGRKGCFEQYASATALIRITKAEMQKNHNSKLWELVDGDIEAVNGKTCFDGAQENDESANKALDLYIKYLSEGILNYCNIFRPGAIILSGGIAKQGDFLINKIRAYCREYDYGYKGTPVPEICVASVGYNSGIIGAAALFF